MYRAGIRELEGRYTTLTRQVYLRVSDVVKRVAISYIGYFGEAEFVELLGNPTTFAALCGAAGLDEFNTASVIAVLSSLKDGLPISSGVAVTGGLAGRRFSVPYEIEQIGVEMGISRVDMERLKYCSRLVAKVDDAAIQDGYRLWFHSMVFSREGMWTIIQIGAKSSLNRLYHWSSWRVSSRGFVDEPHTGLLSDALNHYSLDFTLHANEPLRRSSIDVLSSPISRLRSIHRAASQRNQTSLSAFLEGGEAEPHPLAAPVRVGWSLLEELSSQRFRSFEELLSVRGIGAETLRFLAICSKHMMGVEPCLIDRAAPMGPGPPPCDGRCTELFSNLLEAIRFSSLSQQAAVSIINRLKSRWGVGEAN